MAPLFSLDDRVAIVTGGLGQLGRQFVAALNGQGARVVAPGHDQVGEGHDDEAGAVEDDRPGEMEERVPVPREPGKEILGGR